MPTGYTAPIADGITFEQFAWSCARAFGALVMMRDEPNDAPIPERFEPSDYNQKALERTHTELDRVLSLTVEQAAGECDIDYQEQMDAYDRRMAKAADLRAKYESMLAGVRAWEAPTPDHAEYKAFMEKQITQSIDFDCDMSYDKIPERKSTDGWLAVRTSELRRDLAYHEKAHREEVERTDKRNQWIQALRDSLV